MLINVSSSNAMSLCIITLLLSLYIPLHSCHSCIGMMGDDGQLWFDIMKWIYEILNIRYEILNRKYKLRNLQFLSAINFIFIFFFVISWFQRVLWEKEAREDKIDDRLTDSKTRTNSNITLVFVIEHFIIVKIKINH